MNKRNATKIRETELPAASQKPEPLISERERTISVVNPLPCRVVSFSDLICFSLALASDICLTFPAVDKLTETELHLSVRLTHQRPLDKRSLSVCSGWTIYGAVTVSQYISLSLFLQDELLSFWPPEVLTRPTLWHWSI